MPFRYKAYGLALSSEIELPLTETESETVDVLIRFGEIPSGLNAAQRKGPHFEVGSDDLLFHISEKERIWVRNGSEIVLPKTESIEPDDLAIYVLGSGLGTVLEQRHYCCLHASALSDGERCYLFAGHSGTGKSTLSAALARSGFQHFSDDVCPLAVENGELKALPGYPISKLWPESLQKLDIASAGLPRIQSALDKRRLTWERSGSDTPLKVAGVFVLCPDPDCHTPSIQRVSQTEALNYCRLFRYRSEWHKSPSSQERLFEVISFIAREIPTFRIDRPTESFQLERLVAHVKRAIETLHEPVSGVPTVRPNPI